MHSLVDFTAGDKTKTAVMSTMHSLVVDFTAGDKTKTAVVSTKHGGKPTLCSKPFTSNEFPVSGTQLKHTHTHARTHAHIHTHIHTRTHSLTQTTR